MKTKSAIKEHEMFKSQVCKDQFEAKIEVGESQKSKWKNFKVRKRRLKRKSSFKLAGRKRRNESCCQSWSFGGKIKVYEWC